MAFSSRIPPYGRLRKKQRLVERPFQQDTNSCRFSSFSPEYKGTASDTDTPVSPFLLWRAANKVG